MRRSVVVLTVAASAFACAGHTTTRSMGPTVGSATSITAASTTTEDPKAAVLAAYQRFWQVWRQVNDPPNPSDVRLAKVATNGELELLRNQVTANKAKGYAFRSAQPSHARHRVIQLIVEGAKGTIEDCALDDGVVIERTTGRVINADVVTYLWRVQLLNQGGQWKVADNTRVNKWRGASDCGLRGAVAVLP
jgi:hypothetical protein